MLSFDEINLFNIIDKFQWATYVKKSITIRAILANTNGFIDTLEGRLKFLKGHYICIGVAREIYPYEKEHFEEKYQLINIQASDVDEKITQVKLITDTETIYSKNVILKTWGVYKTKYFPILAVQINEPFELESKTWGAEKGKKGDYIICQNEKLCYICDQTVFATSYECCKI